ncbi:MAG: poly-beta-1,6 N-acetyl-D-glucosamine export porin PgaA [Acidobacteriaceae bacterium]
MVIVPHSLLLLQAALLRLSSQLCTCRSTLRVLALTCALLSVSANRAGASDVPRAPRAEREAAVMQARHGGAKAGLAELKRLVQRYPDDPRLLADTTIVASWARDDRYALDLYDRPLTPKDDAGVAEAAGHAARNLHLYARSLELYQLAHQLEPDRWQPLLGEAMVLTDLGDYAAAAKLMDPVVRHHKDDLDVLRGQGYLCSRLADFICSIAMYQYYLVQSPNDMDVRNDLALALSHVGSQVYASDFYTKEVSPEVPETDFRLSGVAAGEEANWGEVYSPTRALVRADSEIALARLNSIIAAATPRGETWTNAQFDRIFALYDLHRSNEVVSAYEELTRRGIEVPQYALESVAGSYLSLHEPERAEEIYEKLVKESPTDGDLWSGLAYAQMERGHVKQALATIDRAYKDATPWLGIPGKSAPKPNRMRLNLESQAARMRGDVDLLAEEQRRLDRLMAAAPGNESLRWQLASSHLARGWPVYALRESRIADGFASRDELPSMTTVQIEEAAGLRDEVDAAIPALRIRAFDDPSLLRFLKGLRIERGWGFDSDAVFAWGSGIEVGSSSQHSEAHLYSPLFNNRWRGFAHELSDSGNFGATSAERTRTSVGVSYDYDRQSATAEIGYDAGTHRTAANLAAALALNDYWSFHLEADTDSFEVPVRALTGNVHGRSVDADLEWRASELESAHGGLQRVLFSDGNQRAAISGAWTRRVETTPHWQTTISAQEWESGNSLNENRPYFNPSRDFGFGPSATVDWHTWHRYDRSFHQKVNLYVAPYWQANYGTGPSVSAEYDALLKTRQGLEWRLGVTWNTQPYDGMNETSTALNAGITWGSQ